MARNSALVTLLLATIAAIGCGQGVDTSAQQVGPTPTPTQTGGTPTPTPTGTSTPNPTPTPPPASGKTCSFVWLTDWTDIDGTYDFFEVDVDSGLWTNATNAYDGTNVVGYWVSGYDPVFGDILYGAGLSNDGAIALNVAGTTMGDAEAFTDTASHTFYDAADYLLGNSATVGGPVATGGTGNFTGNLSDPDPNANVTPGQGSITISDGTTSETFGLDAVQPTVSYAACSQ
jgi:hypothetical protein